MLTRQSQEHQAQDVTCMWTQTILLRHSTKTARRKIVKILTKAFLALCWPCCVFNHKSDILDVCVCVTDVSYVIAGSYFWLSIKHSLLPTGLSYNSPLPKCSSVHSNSYFGFTASLPFFLSVHPQRKSAHTKPIGSLTNCSQVWQHTHKRRHNKTQHCAGLWFEQTVFF